MESSPKKLTTAEVAMLLGLSPETCKAWARKNHLEKNYTYYWTEKDISNFCNRKSKKNCPPNKVEQIRKLIDDGKTFEQIASECKITTSFLTKVILKNKIMNEEEYKERAYNNVYAKAK